MAAGAKLRKLRKLTAYELPFLKKHSPGPFKVTVPAPSNFLVASYKAGVTDKFYPTRTDFLGDLVGIVRDEVQWLCSEGVTYIQLDAPYYSYYLDPSLRQRMLEAGRDPDLELREGIDGDNACLTDIPRGNLTVALHVCRAIAGAAGLRKVDMTLSRSGFSARWMWIRSFSNTIPKGPEDLSPCAWYRAERMSCSD